MKLDVFNNKSIFITGANGGMGLETSKLIAKQGFSQLVLAARTASKAQMAKKVVEPIYKGKGEIIPAEGFDMNSPSKIESAVKALNQVAPFDILFFQVGGVFFTEDYQYLNFNNQRVEKTIFQNVIGAYITLVNLEKLGLVKANARIVFAGGEGARGIPGMIENPEFKSAQEFKNYVIGKGTQKKYNPMNAIGVSKLASAILTQKLASLNDGRTYVWFSPGLTHGTNGLATVAPLKRFFMEKIMFGISGLLGFSQSPLKGAEKYVKSLAGGYGENGDVLGAPQGKVLGAITNQKPMNPAMTNPLIQSEFWNILQEIYPYSSSKNDAA